VYMCFCYTYCTGNQSGKPVASVRDHRTAQSTVTGLKTHIFIIVTLPLLFL